MSVPRSLTRAASGSDVLSQPYFHGLGPLRCCSRAQGLVRWREPAAHAFADEAVNLKVSCDSDLRGDVCVCVGLAAGGEEDEEEEADR